jgi:hypothetical protein
MTTSVDIVNRALLHLGLTKKISAFTQDSIEAAAANMVYDNVRRRLLRMAPWDCAMNTENLTYITSVVGTPENTSPAPQLWGSGQPSPPWAYEYQYPVDCLRACWVIPATQTGYAGGVPITTAVTGGAPSFWCGPPVKFKVQTDQFYAVTAAAVVSGGVSHVAGDVITLPYGPTTSAPIGAPVQLRVTTISGGGVITAVSVVQQVPNETLGGSYFTVQANPIAMASSTGIGTGAVFNLTQAISPTPQRVILCNQEFATLVYITDVTDPNIMDELFIHAFTRVLAAELAMVLLLENAIKVADGMIKIANTAIEAARNVDANEGLTINDMTPDWIRIRGIDFPSAYSGPYLGYDWGGMWPYFG